MGFQIPGGFVLTPDDLGLNAVNVAPAGVVVVGNIVPLMQLGSFDKVSLIKEAGVGGGTPGSVFIASVGLNGVQWSDGLVNSGLWAGFTNNPRTQWAHLARGQSTATVTTGTNALSEFGKLFSSPYARFAFQNNDAAIASVLTLTVILWR